MEEFQFSDHRFGVADPDMGRSVVPYQHYIVVEIHRMQFAERAAAPKPIHDQHGEACLQIQFPGHGYSPACEQRAADDHPGNQLFILSLSFIIIGHPIQLVGAD